MLATFIGKDRSMGFRKNQTYNIRTAIVDNWLVLWAVNERGQRLYCPYSSLEALLANWEIA